MSRWKNRVSAVGIAVLVAVAGLSGLALYAGSRPAHAAVAAASTLADAPASVATPPTDLSAEELAAGVSDALVTLADRITPAVVQIEVQRERGAAGRVQLGIPEPFRQFFRDPGEPQGPSGEPAPQLASGSGFLVSPDGYIVTNNHVVDGADVVRVRLHDRTVHSAEVIGSDPTTDVAVIKIEGSGLPSLTWGSSDEVKVGELVMAVGNPGVGGGALDYTVTTGIVSAKGRPLSIIQRSLENDPQYGPTQAGYAIENFIQTDAVINPGNSGGPMVDVHGHVIGVNSAIASTDGYYQGYGFAIPSDLARKVSSDLIANGHVTRAWLGVSVTAVTPEDAEVYGLPLVEGVLVQSVASTGPAARAGLETEDVIVAVDDHPVDRPGDLQQLIAEKDHGSPARLRVYRDGKARDVTVELGEAPVGTAAESPRATSPSAEKRMGIEVADLTPELAQRFGLESGGVVVVGVEPWMQAAARGVQVGQKVLELDHESIGSAREFRSRLAHIEDGQAVSLKLADAAGNHRIVSLRVGQ